MAEKKKYIGLVECQVTLYQEVTVEASDKNSAKRLMVSFAENEMDSEWESAAEQALQEVACLDMEVVQINEGEELE